MGKEHLGHGLVLSLIKATEAESFAVLSIHLFCMEHVAGKCPSEPQPKHWMYPHGAGQCTSIGTDREK